MRNRRSLLLALLLAASLGGCSGAAASGRVLTLTTLNDSGVSGAVTFTEVDQTTRVDIAVDPAGNLNMPAHIHPGTCNDLVPQPRFPLENVKDGVSSTVVPAAIDDLFGTGLAVNIHHSNDDLATYTACIAIL